MSIYEYYAQRLLHFARNSPAASRVNDVADFEAVELARCADGIRTHIVEGEPITNTQRIRQSYLRADTIHGVTGWSPNATGCLRLGGRHVK